MHIYAGNIRGTSTDLYNFFDAFVKRAEVFRILQRTTRRPGVCYAVVEIEPDALGQKAVRKLNGQRLLGVPVRVREYTRRYCANERRALHWRDRPWPHNERRQTERRFTPVRAPAVEQQGVRALTPSRGNARIDPPRRMAQGELRCRDVSRPITPARRRP